MFLTLILQGHTHIDEWGRLKRPLTRRVEGNMRQDQKMPAGDDLTDAELDVVSGGGGGYWSGDGGGSPAEPPPTTQQIYQKTVSLLYKAMGA